MARRKGTPMYGAKTGGKGRAGSYYITREADRLLRAAARRSGKSASDVIEFCLRISAARLTRGLAQQIAEISEESIHD